VGRAVAVWNIKCLKSTCRALALGIAAQLSCIQHDPVWAASCESETGPVRAVARVLDAETLALDDGSEVRLIGALAPRHLDSGSEGSTWPPEQQAVAELERLVLGKSVQLEFSGRRADRYGRLLAHVFLRDGDVRVSVQAHMLRSGHARVYVLRDSEACTDELLAAERIAREAGTGLWSHAAYQIRSAEDVRGLLRYRGTYQIIEGQVLETEDVRGQVYLNFGENWREDFTVIIRASDRRSMEAAGFDPKALKGRRIRVRGWLLRRAGPAIEVQHQTQIELVAD
jgi:micrococcal nuclease